MVTDLQAEVEIHLGSIPMRRSGERTDDLPQTKMEDQKSLPNVAEYLLMGKGHLRPSDLVSGDAGALL